MHDPAELPWRLAWRQTAISPVLHRVARVEVVYTLPLEKSADLSAITGVTCCGLAGALWMPAALGRLEGPRCRLCAQIAEVDADLTGIPGNGDECGPMDAWQTSAWQDPPGER